MLLYIYVYQPVMLGVNSGLHEVMSRDKLVYVALVNAVGVLAVMAGCAGGRVPRPTPGATRAFMPQFSRRVQDQLWRIGCLFAAVACLAFMYKLHHSGGLKVFKAIKPQVYAPNGYVSSLPMIGIPATILLAISRQGRRIGLGGILVALCAICEPLVFATLAGRRGSAFVCFITLGMCWCLAKNKLPTVRAVIGGVGVVGVLLLFLIANRQAARDDGADTSVSKHFVDELQSKTQSTSSEYATAAGMILAADHYDHYYWGRRYMVTLFIRPIPRAIWPTKYHDMGFGWMVTNPGLAGFTREQWEEAMGYKVPLGVAGGFVADMYLEFAWLYVIPLFLIGRLYRSVWLKWVSRGGVWSILYIELIGVSVFLPAQSVQAWLVRAMVLTIPTWLFWTFFLRRSHLPRRAASPSHASVTRHQLSGRRVSTIQSDG